MPLCAAWCVDVAGIGKTGPAEGRAMSQHMVKSHQSWGTPVTKEDRQDESQAVFVGCAVALGICWVALFALGSFTHILSSAEQVGIGAALLVLSDLCGFTWLMQAYGQRQSNLKRESRRELAFIREELLREVRVQIRYLGNEVLKPTFELGRAHERFTGELPLPVAPVPAIGRVPRISEGRPVHLQSVKG
jgi:hypothetical protein